MSLPNSPSHVAAQARLGPRWASHPTPPRTLLRRGVAYAHAATSRVRARLHYCGTPQGAPAVLAGGRCTCGVMCLVPLVPVQSVAVHCAPCSVLHAHLHLPALRAWASVPHALCAVPVVHPQPMQPGAMHCGLCSVLPVPASLCALLALGTLPPVRGGGRGGGGAELAWGRDEGCPSPCAISAAEMLPNISCSPKAAPQGGGGVACRRQARRARSACSSWRGHYVAFW